MRALHTYVGQSVLEGKPVFAALYDRLCGWLLIFLATVGFATGHLGDYIGLTTAESSLLMVLGVISLIGARSRSRYAVPVAFFIGIFLLAWSILGILNPALVAFPSDPLENVLRIVVGGWGIYVAVQDFLSWRQVPSS